MTALAVFFYGLSNMATDVEVQFFSHLNGLVLDNKWGDMIRLLDACLVNGVELPGVTSAAIDEQGDLHLTLFAPHKAMLLQVVELTGFEPSSLNQKYRIKGVPSETQLILKPHVAIAETVVTTKGTGKLAALGYDIIFRDDKDVKRVYRAKNPIAQHPFIRVDESISDGVNSYNSSYAKSAMVGLLEHMDHIDDYLNPDVLQLPFDPTDLEKNWKITGTGDSVLRGWSKWYYATAGDGINTSSIESETPSGGNRSFTLVGDRDAFYFQICPTLNTHQKVVWGAGLYSSLLENSMIPNWFLMSPRRNLPANNNGGFSTMEGGSPFMSSNSDASSFITPSSNPATPLVAHTISTAILMDFQSGRNSKYSNDVAAMEMPFSSSDGLLKGVLRHLHYACKAISGNTKPILSDKYIFISDSAGIFSGGGFSGGFYYYIGELE